jgi:hypothetical protein
MTRARIRWKNAARLGAVAFAAALAIALLPGFLRPPAPEPLPPDVGLTGVAAGATGAIGPLADSSPGEPAMKTPRDGLDAERRSVRRERVGDRQGPKNARAGARTGESGEARPVAAAARGGSATGRTSAHRPARRSSPTSPAPAAPTAPSATASSPSSPAPAPQRPPASQSLPSPAAKPSPAPIRPSADRRPGPTSQFGFEY